MSVVRLVVASVALALVGNSLQAKELKSGPQPGDPVGAFTVEKCAGNPSDGIEDGERLCYRCKLGNRPVVAVFARGGAENLPKLIAELNGLVDKHESKKMASFVNLLGNDVGKLKNEAEALVKKSKADKVAVVVPSDHERGPENYSLNPDADLTVLVYNRGKVFANYALTADQLDDAAIGNIKESATKMLN